MNEGINRVMNDMDLEIAKENLKKLELMNVLEDSEYKERLETLKNVGDENLLNEFYNNNISRTDYVAAKELNERILRGENLTPVTPYEIINSNKLMVEEKITKFKKSCDLLEKTLIKLKSSLVLDNKYDLNMTGFVRELDLQFKELQDEANVLIRDIDEFRSSFSNDDFSMSVKDINSVISEFKDRIKKIKISQIDKYNSRVDVVNERISNLKSLPGLDDSIASLLNSFGIIGKCDVVIKSYRDMKYLNSLDYDKLIEIEQKVIGIYENLKINYNPLEDNIVVIEKKISSFEQKSDGSILEDDLFVINDDLMELRIKLEDSKDKFGSDDYSKYLMRINNVSGRVSKLVSSLNYSKIGNNDYKLFQHALERLLRDIHGFDELIDSFKGNVVASTASVFDGVIDDYFIRLDNYRKRILDKCNNHEFDDVQSKNLMDKLDLIDEAINKSKNKLKDPLLFANINVFEFLNGQIDGVGRSISELVLSVNALEKPIKDKSIQNKIDSAIKRIEEEIKIISSHLEHYRDDDIDKYNLDNGRLRVFEHQLDDVKSNYSKKCPLLVKSVKSAKEIYKRHKKPLLIAAGLSTIALLHATVGPLIIPAIMHGNLMIMNKVPAFRSFLGGINGVLARMINAKEVVLDGHRFWQLASGVKIDQVSSTASLLKGVAMSGIGSAVLVSPVVAGVKKIVEKMKQYNIKNGIINGFNIGVNKVKKAASGIKNKVGSGINSAKQKGINAKDKVAETVKDAKDSVDVKYSNYKKRIEIAKDIKDLLSKYQKSGKSIDEFANDNQLEDIDKLILETYDKKLGGR